jgi:CheY-like chemotaxis protein
MAWQNHGISVYLPAREGAIARQENGRAPEKGSAGPVGGAHRQRCAAEAQAGQTSVTSARPCAGQFGRATNVLSRRNAMSESQESGPGGPRRTRVLVVEDEFIVSLALRVQLESMGCEVVGTARDAPNALQQVEELRPDVVLMDIGLSGGDGVAATRAIMEQVPTRVIVVTAYGDDRVQAALEAGARLALTKPIVDEQLAEAISQVTMIACEPPNDPPG